jgi:hypothetical protein
MGEGDAQRLVHPGTNLMAEKIERTDLAPNLADDVVRCIQILERTVPGLKSGRLDRSSRRGSPQPNQEPRRTQRMRM